MTEPMHYRMNRPPPRAPRTVPRDIYIVFERKREDILTRPNITDQERANMLADLVLEKHNEIRRARVK